MRLDRTLAVALLAAFLGSTHAARAAEGVIEINEDSVQAGGGFPVTITGPGSYMLTSNLVVTNANQSALVLSGNEITLDLRGFAQEFTVPSALDDNARHVTGFVHP